MADYGKAGAETRVNIQANGNQITPSPRRWQTGVMSSPLGTGGTATGAVSARIFNADGTPASDEIDIAASTRNGMAVKSVPALAGGGFAIGY